MDRKYLNKLVKLKQSYDNYLNVLLGDNNNDNFNISKKTPICSNYIFHIKLHGDGHFKEHYLKDAIYHRSNVIGMNKSINLDIFEIFDWNMILNFHTLKISYKSFSKFVIKNVDLNNLNIVEKKFSCFLDIFKSKEYVISLSYHKQCKVSSDVNILHPKYNHNEGRSKKYVDDAERIKKRKSQQRAYNQTSKGKISNSKRQK